MVERSSGGADSCRVLGRLVGDGVSLATLMTCALWAPAQRQGEQDFSARGLGLPTLGARLRLVAGLRQLFCRPPPQPADPLLLVLGGAPKAAQAARAAVVARGGNTAVVASAPAAVATGAAASAPEELDDAERAAAQATILASPEELAVTAARVRLRSKAVPIAGLYALRDVQQWSEKQVLKFLKMHGLSAYGTSFSEEAIDGDCLLGCADWGETASDVEFITGGRPQPEWQAEFPGWERDFMLLREIADVWLNS